MNQAFTVRPFGSENYTDILPGRSDIMASSPARWDVSGDALALRDWTEVTYKLPLNTSMVNVTGPVFNETALCYARLEPEPWWWSRHMPVAYPQKPGERADQTLFVLPTDPTEEYQLVIGSRGDLCTVSGVTTYAYVE